MIYSEKTFYQCIDEIGKSMSKIKCADELDYMMPFMYN